MSSMQIPLISGKYPNRFAIIDEEDYPLISDYKWYVAKGKNTFYAMANRPTGAHGPKTIMMHRLILGVSGDVMVDHNDLNGLNNTRSNLRPANATEQNANKGLQANNTTGFRGVTYIAQTDRWLATINRDYDQINLGSYATIEEAARAFDTAALRFWGEYARLNFPDDFRPVDLDAMRLYANNTTGFRGVGYHKKRRRFLAYISQNGKQTELGTFTTAAEAAQVRDREVKARGLHLPLNFPDQ